MSSRACVILFGCMVVVIAAAAPAQPGDGHILLGVNTTLPKTRQFQGSILTYDPALDRFTTLLRTTPRFDTSGSFGALTMASDNCGLVALGHAAGGAIVQTYRKLTVSGGITTVASASSMTAGPTKRMPGVNASPS